MGKRRNYYNSNHPGKKSRGDDFQFGSAKLESGVTGVLITHDRNREKFCRNDSFRLFNYLADEWFGEHETLQTKQADGKEDKTHEWDGEDGIEEENEKEDDCDIDAALSKEVSEIKTKFHPQNKQKQRFSAMKSGCNNLVFIRVAELDIKPSEFVMQLVKTISMNLNSNIPVSRNILRIHPADVSCKAHLTTIKECAESYLPQAFNDILKKSNTDGEDLKPVFNILYRGRNNDHMHMHTVVDVICSAVDDSCPEWNYNCRSQDIHILVDVIRAVCTMSVVKDYVKQKKYNVRELFSANEMKNYDQEPVEPVKEVVSEEHSKQVENKTNDGNDSKCAEEDCENNSPKKEIPIALAENSNVTE